MQTRYRLSPVQLYAELSELRERLRVLESDTTGFAGAPVAVTSHVAGGPRYGLQSPVIDHNIMGAPWDHLWRPHYRLNLDESMARNFPKLTVRLRYGGAQNAEITNAGVKYKIPGFYVRLRNEGSGVVYENDKGTKEHFVGSGAGFSKAVNGEPLNFEGVRHGYVPGVSPDSHKSVAIEVRQADRPAIGDQARLLAPREAYRFWCRLWPPVAVFLTR